MKLNQVFYDPDTLQVMAVYLKCRYQGTAWQDQGYLSIETDMKVTRDHKLTIVDGEITAVTDSKNSFQPAEDKDKKTKAAQIVEIIKSDASALSELKKAL